MHQKLLKSRPQALLFLALALVASSQRTLAFQVEHETEDSQLQAQSEAVIWQQDLARGYRSNYIVVKCRDTMPDPRVGATHAFGEKCADWGVIDIRKVYDDDFKDPEAAKRIGLDRTFVLEVPGNTDTATMAREFDRLFAEVEWAEIDAIGGVAGFVPNDVNFNLQYGMHNIGQNNGVVDADVDAPEAWTIHTGESNPITIAVIDSGVNPHPEYTDRMVPGFNTTNPDTPDLTTDGCPHGTHVAGILAAKGNNTIGVAGMNWGAYLMPVRVVNGCSGSELWCANGIEWAVDHGADVLNMSLQYYAGTSALNEAVQYAHESGVVLIAAAGNQHGNVVAFPARFTNCMAVSAINRSNTLAVFSNFGNEVDITAPGDSIWSTWTNNNYLPMNGTSMACPHVAGAAALMLSRNPTLTNTQILDILTDTADDIGPPGFDIQYGHGRANAAAAVEAAGLPPVVGLISSNPPDSRIDARQPSDVDGTNPTGWSSITLRFGGNVAGIITVSDLSLSQQGGVGSPPAILEVNPVADDTVSVQLSGPIAVGAWTTFTHIASATSVRLGYLPGDVNGDRTSSPVDILGLIDSLNDVGPNLPLSSTDINRSGVSEPSDILRVIDLLNGADAYDVYNGMMLP